MRVLFVEDDSMNRRVVRDMLAVAGVEMAEAQSAEIGLHKVGEEEFDLVLMDIRMPGMDGLTAIRKLRERPDRKAKLPVVVVTADTSLHLRDECLSAGADDLIRKPVAMDALFECMGRLMAAGGDAMLI